MSNRPSRRDILGAAAIGAARIAAGFPRPQEAAADIPVRFVGDGLERGHHWFTPDAERLHVDRRERHDVVVVGGGFAGCLAAWRLLDAGVEDVVVLELEDVAGGLARRGVIGATAVPFGGTTIAVPGPETSPAVLRLLDAAGVDRSRTTPMAPRVWTAGRWHPWDVSPQALPESRPATRDLDATSVRDWLGGAGKGAAMRFAERWCLMRFGARSGDVSAGALVADVARRFGAGGDVLTVSGGLSALLDPVVERIGARFRPGRVAVLARTGGDGEATVRAVDSRDAKVTDHSAKAAILAVPPFIASRIAPALRQRQRFDVPETSPWMITAVMVSEWPKGFDPGVPFHQCDDERASLIVHAGRPPDGVIVHHRPFPAPAATPSQMFLRDLDPPTARDWALRELAPVFPDLASVARRVEVRRIGHGATRPAPGFASAIAPRLGAPLGPIHPCGADTTGLPCAESAIADGVRAAEGVLAAMGRLDRSWL